VSLAQYAARLAKTQAMQRNPGLRQRAANALKAAKGNRTTADQWTAVKAENRAYYQSHRTRWVFDGATNTLEKDSSR
jgi:hypothetical protein